MKLIKNIGNVVILLQQYKFPVNTNNNPPPSLLFQFRPHFRSQAFIFCSVCSLLFNHENLARDMFLINWDEVYSTIFSQLIFLASADSSTDRDPSPRYFSGPTSSQTLILCPRLLDRCDPGLVQAVVKGNEDPATKSPQFCNFLKFLFGLSARGLLSTKTIRIFVKMYVQSDFIVALSIFQSVNIFRFSKVIVKS